MQAMHLASHTHTSLTFNVLYIRQYLSLALFVSQMWKNKMWNEGLLEYIKNQRVTLQDKEIM